MNNNPYLKVLLFVLLVSMLSSAKANTTQYVTDELEVTMRSGTSTANNIVRMLKSGQSVRLLEEDLASKYSLVETQEGKKGYVLSRFLSSEKTARLKVEGLNESVTRQKETISSLNTELASIKSQLGIEISDNSSLKKTLLASENELSHVRNASENTLKILDNNEQLEVIVEELRSEKQALSDENLDLKDSTQLDWFIRGAAVSLIAFFLGILVTRIRWKKRDSWGSY